MTNPPQTPELAAAAPATKEIILTIGFEPSPGCTYTWKIGDTEYPIIDGIARIPATPNDMTTLSGSLIERPSGESSTTA